MSNRNQEPGAASILIELSDSRITVTHGDHPEVALLKGEAVKGDWDKLFVFLQAELGLEEMPL